VDTIHHEDKQMTLEFATKEAQRRTEALGTDHYVYESLQEVDEYIVTARQFSNGQAPVYTSFNDGSELES
jgi:hypothetical protein